ncbi:MAG: GNAT family N-acetyltransferase [Syntrophorhabdus sp.]|nr:GNAT family N-acetyltransferase [Syntrophorhabdus sp.]
MSAKIIYWQDTDEEQLHRLYTTFPYPPYFGSPIVDERLQEYRFELVKRSVAQNPGAHFAAVDGRGRVLCAAQVRRTPHLSDHFGVEVAGIGNEAFLCDEKASNAEGFILFAGHLRKVAENAGVAFMTTTAASQTYQWIRALEEAGFRYADGFRHVTALVDEDYSAFLRDDLIMRGPVESDFDEIAYAYKHTPFPNHLLYEPEFDKEKVTRLYVKRYREVHEKLGRVFVAEWKGKFAGALNGIIDPDIRKELKIAVNHLSQGLIVHPRAAGTGVALALVACRNEWYREQRMKYGYFGSNINNLAMIRGLEKMGTRHAGIEINMVLRLKDKERFRRPPNADTATGSGSKSG